MASYRVRTQWENDSKSTSIAGETNTTQGFEGKVVQIRKSTLVVAGILFAAIVSAIVLFYLKAGSVEGTWVRQIDDSDNQGMMVRVESNNGVLVGTVVSAGTDGTLFQVDQIKWANIRKTGFCQYECYDLIASIRLNELSYHYGDAVAIIKVSTNGKVLTLQNTSTERNTIGLDQTWIKVK